MNHKIHKNYLSSNLREHFIQLSKDFISKHYTEENLKSHVAYISDTRPNRQSYAFAFTNQVDCELPSLWSVFEHNDFYDLHNEMLLLLGLSPQSRVLINFQFYYENSEPVPFHFDGELLDFEVKEDGSLEIHEAIRPEKVAVLTLVNEVEGGVGTTLQSAEGSQTAICHAGDLIIFDNIKNLHGVHAFAGKSSREDRILRLTIGWRSLDDKCWYYKRTEEQESVCYPMTLSQAEETTKGWLDTKWPIIWEKFKNQEHKAAF